MIPPFTSVARRMCAAFLFASAATAMAEPAAAERTLRMIPAEAELVLSGTSTLHRWRCTSTRIQGEMVLTGDKTDWEAWVHAIREGRSLPESTRPAPQVYAVFRPDSLQCPHPRMKRDLLEAMRARRYPEVRYEVAGLDLLIDRCESDPGVRRATVRGRLSLAGETRDLAHDARLQFLDEYAVEVRGEIRLNMRDFNIDPPVALMGLLRAHEDVRITYRILARLADADTGAASARSAPGNSE